MSGQLHKQPFAQLPEWLLYSGVSDRAIRLYAVLDRHGDSNGRCFPGRQRLTELLSCSIASVDRALLELRDVGAIVIEARWREDGGQSSNDYWLWPASPQGGAPPLTSERPPPLTAEEGNKNESQCEREPEEQSVGAADAAPTTLDLAVPTEQETLCNELADAIERHRDDHVRPKITAAWTRDMRLLLERGPQGAAEVHAVTPERVRQAIGVVFSELAEPEGSSSFTWADQVRSSGALRRHWLAMSAAAANRRKGRVSPGARNIARAAQRLAAERGEELDAVGPRSFADDAAALFSGELAGRKTNPKEGMNRWT